MRSRRTSRSARACVAVALALSSALAAMAPAGGENAPADAAANRERTAAPSARTSLSDGVDYQVRKVSGPNRVHILTIDPSSVATMDVTTAAPRLPKFAQVSTMALRTTAVAAINGDFGLWPGRPGHAYAEDGVFDQTTTLGVNGKNFAVRLDESASYIGAPDVSLDVRPDGGAAFVVDRWNQGAPRPAEIAGYTRFGGTLEKPPKDACYVRLVSSGTPAWLTGDAGIDGAYVVGEQSCGGIPMAVGYDTVLAAKVGTLGADTLGTLLAGQIVRLSWSFGWAGITDAIGGMPVLVDNGELAVTPQCNTTFCRRNPRTAIGIKPSGAIMLVVIDGRQSNSIGMTLYQEAVFMRNLGAVRALNLDGGGSSTMWIRGQGVVNRPSDGNERAVSSAVLVLPGADPGELILGSASPVVAVTSRAPAASGLSRAQIEASWTATIRDPGSTGGLLASLKRPALQLSPRERTWRRQFLEAQATHG